MELRPDKRRAPNMVYNLQVKSIFYCENMMQ